MIPSWSPFGDVTFGDLSWPEDRRRRAVELLEKFDFPEPSDAFAMGAQAEGCWRRVQTPHQADCLPYRLAEFCANNKIHTYEIAINSWAEFYIYGDDPDEARQRGVMLKEFLEECQPDRGSNAFELFNDNRLFDRYHEYYGNENYQKWETVFLVFADSSIMHHLMQSEISPIGWALWKYAIRESMLFGMHPTWAFEKPREAQVITQGSGYEFVIRIVPDYSQSHLRLTHPAFMFLDQEDALKFRTTLDMLGFYDQQSRTYEPLKPTPIFYQSSSGTNNSRLSQIRAANFVVM